MKHFLGLLVVFGISDGVLTYFMVDNGLAREANPFLLTLAGELNFLILKVIAILLCAIILWDIYRRLPRAALISTSCFAVCYGGIVFWNLSWLFVALI